MLLAQELWTYMRRMSLGPEREGVSGQCWLEAAKEWAPDKERGECETVRHQQPTLEV